MVNHPFIFNMLTVCGQLDKFWLRGVYFFSQIAALLVTFVCTGFVISALFAFRCSQVQNCKILNIINTAIFLLAHERETWRLVDYPANQIAQVASCVHNWHRVVNNGQAAILGKMSLQDRMLTQFG